MKSLKTILASLAPAALAAVWLPLTAPGSPITDIIDWDTGEAALVQDETAGDAPDGGGWLPTVFTDGDEPRWLGEFAPFAPVATEGDPPDPGGTASVPSVPRASTGGTANVLAGDWNASRWIEVDLWAEDRPADRSRKIEQFLAELAATDWIGISAYGDGANEEIYGLDEYKLMVPEPSVILLLAAAFAVAALVGRRMLVYNFKRLR